MTEHTKTDGLPGMDFPGLPQVLDKSLPRSERMNSDKIECNACPVLCQISVGRSGACDRYANCSGTLVRVDPVLLLRRKLAEGEPVVVPFAGRAAVEGSDDPAGSPVTTPWRGDLLLADEVLSSSLFPSMLNRQFVK